MNPVYEKAVEAIWDEINGGVAHPNDFEKVVDMFNRLLEAGERVKSDEIYQYLTKKSDLFRDAAHDIEMIYEVLETVKYKSLAWWDDEFIKNEILKRAQS